MSSDPVAQELLQHLPQSPDAYLHQLDFVADRALLVRFEQATYRAASFLDDRVLGPAATGAWVSIGDVVSAARRATNLRSLHFIFHTGHVGSTLVSRLLDDVNGVLSLREPLPLRSIAEVHDTLGEPESLLGEPQFTLALATCLQLWSRGYERTESVILKATSSAGRVALPLLTIASKSRAIYLNLGAEPYVATLLAGANSPIDLRGHGPGRMRRLKTRLSAELPPLHSMSIGELAAMSWLAESWTQREAIAHGAGRVVALDFDRFLSRIEESMRRILHHFGLPIDALYLSTVGRSPVLTRYSKAPENAYTPSIRAEVLAESRRYNSDEIAKGMQWLDRHARSDSAAAAILDGS